MVGDRVQGACTCVTAGLHKQVVSTLPEGCLRCDWTAWELGCKVQRARGCDVNGWCMLGESRMHAGMDEQDRI